MLRFSVLLPVVQLGVEFVNWTEHLADVLQVHMPVEAFLKVKNAILTRIVVILDMEQTSHVMIVMIDASDKKIAISSAVDRAGN